MPVTINSKGSMVTIRATAVPFDLLAAAIGESKHVGKPRVFGDLDSGNVVVLVERFDPFTKHQIRFNLEKAGVRVAYGS